MMYDKNIFILQKERLGNKAVVFYGWSPKTNFESSSTRAPEFLHFPRPID